jgi:hypothetical protein
VPGGEVQADIVQHGGITVTLADRFQGKYRHTLYLNTLAGELAAAVLMSPRLL